jgi:hypothetical protein
MSFDSSVVGIGVYYAVFVSGEIIEFLWLLDP